MKLTKHEKKELKELLHNVCVARDGGECLRCGKTTTLCASHIYPKGRYKKMEFEIDNVKTLCYACHIPWWHKNPIEANKWYEETIDKVRRDRLLLMTQTINKHPIDYKMIKVYLRSLLNSGGA